VQCYGLFKADDLQLKKKRPIIGDDGTEDGWEECVGVQAQHPFSFSRSLQVCGLLVSRRERQHGVTQDFGSGACVEEAKSVR
jgi:hypothetical protein